MWSEVSRSFEEKRRRPNILYPELEKDRFPKLENFPRSDQRDRERFSAVSFQRRTPKESDDNAY
jgi:hypothetical protein